MSARPDFPLPDEETRKLSYRIAEAIIVASSEIECSVASEATTFAAALVLIGCAKPNSLSQILRMASARLREMSQHPDKLDRLKRIMSPDINVRPN